MRSLLLLFLSVLGAALVAGQPAGAFLIAPADDGQGRYVVVIEAAHGEHVPLAMLPPPYDRLGAAAWADGGISFEWSYFRSPERGRAEIRFDKDGRAAMTFTFSGNRLADGDTVAAAVVVVDRDDEPFMTVYATARVAGDRFAGGENLHRSAALLDMPPGGWGDVAGFVFFTPKYYAIQRLDDDGVAHAMRRMVARVTGGRGTERRAEPIGH